MNDLIEELAEEAIINSLFEPIEPNFTIGTGNGKMVIPVVFAEQLTKLVVEECIRYFNEDYRRDFDVKWHDDLSAKLSDHFNLGTNLV
jgi:hypothetical protein